MSLVQNIGMVDWILLPMPLLSCANQEQLKCFVCIRTMVVKNIVKYCVDSSKSSINCIRLSACRFGYDNSEDVG